MSNAISDVWMKEFEVDAALKSFIKEKRCRVNFLYIDLNKEDGFVGHSFLRVLLLKICQKITLLEHLIQDKYKAGEIFGDVKELLNRITEIDDLSLERKIMTEKFIIELASYQEILLTDTSQIVKLFTETALYINDVGSDLTPVFMDCLYKDYSKKCTQVKTQKVNTMTEEVKENQEDQNLDQNISEKSEVVEKSHSSNEQNKTPDLQPHFPKEKVAKNSFPKSSEPHKVTEISGNPADLGKQQKAKYKPLQFVKKPNYLTDYGKKKFGSTVVPKRNPKMGDDASLLVNRSRQIPSRAPNVHENMNNDPFENIQVLRNADCCSQFSAPSSRSRISINNASKALKLQLPSNQVRKRHPFTKLSDAMLVHGVKKFGKNQWRKILEFYNFPAHRTNVHLKDRWRTLVDRGEVMVERDCLSIIAEELKILYNKVDDKIKSIPDEESSECSGSKKNGPKSKGKSRTSKANTIDDFFSDETSADTIKRSASRPTQKERRLPSGSETTVEENEAVLSQTSTMPGSTASETIYKINEGASRKLQANTKNTQSARENSDRGSSTADNSQYLKKRALEKSEILRKNRKNEDMQSIHKNAQSGREDDNNNNTGSTDGLSELSKKKLIKKRDFFKKKRKIPSSLPNFVTVPSSDEISLSSGDESLFKSVKSSHQRLKTQDQEIEIKRSEAENELTKTFNRRKRRRFNLFDGEGERLTWSGIQEYSPPREYRELIPQSVQPVQKKQQQQQQQQNAFKRKEWKNWEVENLRRGINMYGVGKWSQILENYKFDNRSSLNLKDKYRNLKDKNEI